MSTNTEHYALQIDQGSDIFNPLTSIFPNFQKIDTAMWANKLGGIVTGTHLLSGSVHAITVSDAEGFAVFRFVATANYTEGQTFTVNGTPVTAATTAGTSLGSGCFVINQNVLCCLVGTQLTLYVSDTGGTAADSEKLGGELPSYYATATQLTGVQAIANNALQTANSANTAASGAAATASAAQQAAQWTLLWTNNNPVTTFNPQSISILDSGYTSFLVVCAIYGNSASAKITVSEILFRNASCVVSSVVNFTQPSTRQFTHSEGSISVQAGYRNSSTPDNSVLVPLYVYGMKNAQASPF